ncbi:MAG TPA: SGNH/GDSL hydrolase family protein, partial [Rhodospirillaceae bacterium]|nr:SGNH/GDSL hydrolase family protein [Rhodospirillaceae bacterium]
CAVSPDLMAVNYPLRRLAGRMAGGGTPVVVVIGSGSSLGHGVSSPARAYPARLAADLEDSLGRKLPVQVRTAAGLTAVLVAEKLDEVLRLRPGLVVWETGTTDAAKGVELGQFGEAVIDSVHRLHGEGIDVVLVDIQYSPQTAAVLNFEPYLDYLHRIADVTDSLVFRRWDVMHELIDSGRFNPSPDGAAEQFRNADYLNGCVARLLANLIAAGTR